MWKENTQLRFVMCKVSSNIITKPVSYIKTGFNYFRLDKSCLLINCNTRWVFSIVICMFVAYICDVFYLI